MRRYYAFYDEEGELYHVYDQDCKTIVGAFDQYEDADAYANRLNFEDEWNK